MVAPVTLPPSNTPGDFAGNPVLFDQKKMEWYFWFQSACPQFNTLASDLQGEILAAAEVAAAASATAAANAVLASKLNTASPSYTGTLTGGTGVVNLGSGQVYKAADGKVGLGIAAPAQTLHIQDATANNGTMQLGGTSFYGTVKHDASVTGANVYDVSSASGGGHIFQRGGTTQFMTDLAGNLTPGVDNAQTMGSAAYRWSQAYAAIGTINTSDAREKTDVRGLADDEIEAAKALSKEIGTYQFLASVKDKGDKARHHIGMTVQRAIEIMRHHGLDPFSYGFICYDEWDDAFENHPAMEARDAVLDESGSVVEPAIEAQAAWTEQTLKAGDRYSFRYDQLTLFIARGIDARLAALEAA